MFQLSNDAADTRWTLDRAPSDVALDSPDCGQGSEQRPPSGGALDHGVTSLVEEILLFGFPIALAAIFLRPWPAKPWVRRAAIVGGAVVVVGLRMLGHVDWGQSGDRCRAMDGGRVDHLPDLRNVSPLGAGHIMFDVLVVLSARSPSSSATTIFTVTICLGLPAFIGLIVAHVFKSTTWRFPPAPAVTLTPGSWPGTASLCGEVRCLITGRRRSSRRPWRPAGRAAC